MIHKTTMNQVKHTANTLYVLLDLFVIATPFRFFHVFFTITMGSVYILFNGLFFLNGRSLATDLAPAEGAAGRAGERAHRGWRGGADGEPDIYNYLNWHKPVEAIITCVMAMFLCVLAQLLLFFVFRLRVCVWQKLFGGEGWRMESELQNIVVSQSTSYNTIDENAEEGSVEKKPIH